MERRRAVRVSRPERKIAVRRGALGKERGLSGMAAEPSGMTARPSGTGAMGRFEA